MRQAFIRRRVLFAEMELAITGEQVKSGLEKARAKGKMNVSEMARVCGVSRPTVYQY